LLEESLPTGKDTLFPPHRMGSGLHRHQSTVSLSCKCGRAPKTAGRRNPADSVELAIMVINMDAVQLTAYAKQAALDLGFNVAGICLPDPLPAFEIYRNWIQHNRHAGMAYLSREDVVLARSDPRRVLPGCRSILVAGMCYLPQRQELLHQKQWSLAAYAAGKDYHTLLKERLEQLAARLQVESGLDVHYRTYTDTGPLLEKALAVQAGLGWIGRNGCLINPDLGSYLFLGEILLDLPLLPDAPFTADFCGKCSACINSCPSTCILPDRTLQSDRCLSYLTIEHRGAIAPELHSSFEGWLFGCDVCQDVCPWNRRFARPGAEPSFQFREAYKALGLQQLLEMQEEQFRLLFKDSPIKRTKLAGLQRNAMILAGNAHDPVLIPLLRRHLLQNPDPDLRMHAAWSLSHFPDHAAGFALQDCIHNEPLSEVRQVALQAFQDWQESPS